MKSIKIEIENKVPHYLHYKKKVCASLLPSVISICTDEIIFEIFNVRRKVNYFTFLPAELQELLVYYSVRSIHSLSLVCKGFAEIGRSDKLWNSIITEFNNMPPFERLFWKRRFLGGTLVKVVNQKVKKTISFGLKIVCVSHTNPFDFCYINTAGEVRVVLYGEIAQFPIIKNFFLRRNQVVKRILQIDDYFCVLFLDGDVIIRNHEKLVLKLEGIEIILKYENDLIIANKTTISRITLNPVSYKFQANIKFTFTDLFIRQDLYIVRDNKTFGVEIHAFQELTSEFLESLTDQSFEYITERLSFSECNIMKNPLKPIDTTVGEKEQSGIYSYAII